MSHHVPCLKPEPTPVLLLIQLGSEPGPTHKAAKRDVREDENSSEGVVLWPARLNTARTRTGCVLLNSPGCNSPVAGTSWLTNGLITAEHSGPCAIIYLQAVGAEHKTCDGGDGAQEKDPRVFTLQNHGTMCTRGH